MDSENWPLDYTSRPCRICFGPLKPASQDGACDSCNGFVEEPVQRPVREFIPVAVVFPASQIREPYTCWTEATDEWWFDIAYRAQVEHARTLARVLRGRVEVL